MGAATEPLGDARSGCPRCGSGGLKIACDTDAEGRPERLTISCPTCGPIKQLHSRPPWVQKVDPRIYYKHINEQFINQKGKGE